LARGAQLTYVSGMQEQRRADNNRRERHEAMQRLDSIKGEPTFLGSAMASAGRRAAEHFAGRDPNEAPQSVDAVELWGRRIGRALSLIGVVALATYLYLTYLR
jgi:hypothetical protein